MEYGADNSDAYQSSIFVNAFKTPVRARIEELGMKWLGIVCGPWFDFVRPIPGVFFLLLLLFLRF